MEPFAVGCGDGVDIAAGPEGVQRQQGQAKAQPQAGKRGTRRTATARLEARPPPALSIVDSSPFLRYLDRSEMGYGVGAMRIVMLTGLQSACNCLSNSARLVGASPE